MQETDQENHSSKPSQANSLPDPISKNLSQNRADGVARVKALSLNPNTTKKKKLLLRK
jgi:hypothetical protein